MVNGLKTCMTSSCVFYASFYFYPSPIYFTIHSLLYNNSLCTCFMLKLKIQAIQNKLIYDTIWFLAELISEYLSVYYIVLKFNLKIRQSLHIKIYIFQKSVLHEIIWMLHCNIWQTEKRKGEQENLFHYVNFIDLKRQCTSYKTWYDIFVYMYTVVISG